MNVWLLFAAVSGFFAVAAASFAAHSAQDYYTESAVSMIFTAARYEMYHSLALVGVVLLAARPAGWTWSLRLSASAFALGILLFSGGLYLYALSEHGAFAMITPGGGAAFMIGWLALALSAVRDGK